MAIATLTTTTIGTVYAVKQLIRQSVRQMDLNEFSRHGSWGAGGPPHPIEPAIEHDWCDAWRACDQAIALYLETQADIPEETSQCAITGSR